MNFTYLGQVYLIFVKKPIQNLYLGRGGVETKSRGPNQLLTMRQPQEINDKKTGSTQPEIFLYSLKIFFSEKKRISEKKTLQFFPTINQQIHFAC